MAVLSVANVIRLTAVVLMLAGIVYLLPGQQVSQPATPHHGWYGVGDAGADGGVVPPDSWGFDSQFFDTQFFDVGS